MDIVAIILIRRLLRRRREARKAREAERRRKNRARKAATRNVTDAAEPFEFELPDNKISDRLVVPAQPEDKVGDVSRWLLALPLPGEPGWPPSSPEHQSPAEPDPNTEVKQAGDLAEAKAEVGICDSQLQLSKSS